MFSLTSQFIFFSAASIAVLMNLIGNAVKFTAQGHVQVFCSIDSTSQLPADEVALKFTIEYVNRSRDLVNYSLCFIGILVSDCLNMTLNSCSSRFNRLTVHPHVNLVERV